MLILANIYYPNILGKLAGERPDEAITVRIVFALLAWLGAIRWRFMGDGAVWFCQQSQVGLVLWTAGSYSPDPFGFLPNDSRLPALVCPPQRSGFWCLVSCSGSGCY